MSQSNTDIKLKRSKNTISDLSGQELLFGEPLFIDNTTPNLDTGALKDPVNAYLAIGRKKINDDDTVNVENSPVFKALSLDNANRLVFYEVDESGKPCGIVTESGEPIPITNLVAIPFDKEQSTSSKYHILCQGDDNKVYKFMLDDLGIFINDRSVMKGAAWNDYAEVRPISSDYTPGLVVCDSSEGLVLSSERLQACPHVISDTYGHLIGEISENAAPIAVSGRVLVAMDCTLNDIQIGDCVCASLNGLASKMTRQEIKNYPDRILGIVCEIPSYSTFGSVEVDDRIWINIK